MIVKSRTLKLAEPFITEKGGVIRDAVVAYEAYGQEGKPTVLITHGGLSSHHSAGRYAKEDPLPGFWDDIIGPGKAIDTHRYRVLSANALGSMYGSASPLTINPDTGKPYGPDFPEITLIDMVRMDPAFNNGRYEIGAPKLALHLIQQVAGIYYTHERFIKERYWDTVPEGKDSQAKRSLNAGDYLLTGVEAQIEGRDPNCYIRILNAINSYDLGRDVGSYKKGVHRIKCPVLLINISTDAEFPPHWAEELAEILNRKNPGQAQVKIIDSIWGHMGCVQEGKAIGKNIADFLFRL
jgi:homoserine acetyltransferase